MYTLKLQEMSDIHWRCQMFKSLRKKFIATAVGSVAVVIAILAIALNFINFYKLEERIDTTFIRCFQITSIDKNLCRRG